MPLKKCHKTFIFENRGGEFVTPTTIGGTGCSYANYVCFFFHFFFLFQEGTIIFCHKLKLWVAWHPFTRSPPLYVSIRPYCVSLLTLNREE